MSKGTNIPTILESHDLATAQNNRDRFWTKGLKKKLQPGNKVKIFYNPGNPSNRVLNILSIVDTDYIVCKSWSKRKQDWIYSVEHIYFFWLHFESGSIE